MTQEQKDWYNYGRLKAAWLSIRELEPGNERILTQALWDARRKAYSWRTRGDCNYCKHCPEDGDNMKTWADACFSCLYNERIFPEAIEADNWEPK